MKYFITDYKNNQAKEDLRSLGLFCYSLRSEDNNWGEIASIEERVLVNRYGSIVTNEEIMIKDTYPDNFVDFKEFSDKNTKVNSICELTNNIEDYGIIDLSNESNNDNEFARLFDIFGITEQIKELEFGKQIDYFIQHYNPLGDLRLINMGGHIYQIFHISNNKNKNKTKDMEL